MPSVKPNLLARLFRRGLLNQALLALALFSTAGTLKFWQAWAYLAVSLAAGSYIAFYFYRRDPQLMERRLLKKETAPAQKLFIFLWRLLIGISLVLAGYDHRVHWSSAVLAPVPLWVELLSFLFILTGQAIFFEVIKANSFAASVIQVERNQRVISTGLYRFVRHPMYVAFIVMTVFAPLALGSYLALPPALLVVPIIGLRLLDEEKMLRRDLPGYVEYCAQTRCRLLPYVW